MDWKNGLKIFVAGVIVGEIPLAHLAHMEHEPMPHITEPDYSISVPMSSQMAVATGTLPHSSGTIFLP